MSSNLLAVTQSFLGNFRLIILGTSTSDVYYSRRQKSCPLDPHKPDSYRLRCSDLSPGPEPIRAVPELRVPLEEV